MFEVHAVFEEVGDVSPAIWLWQEDDLMQEEEVRVKVRVRVKHERRCEPPLPQCTMGRAMIMRPWLLLLLGAHMLSHARMHPRVVSVIG